MIRTRLRQLVPAACVVAASFALVACGSRSTSGNQGAGTIRVVVSTNVYGDIVRQIAGDKVKITALVTDPGADPHSYEANTQNQLAISKADLVIENGGGYDDFMDAMLKSAKNSKATVLNVVDISGKKSAAGEELNEHLWYDFPTMEKLTDQVVAVLQAEDSANASTFVANANALKEKLQGFEATEAEIKRLHAGDGVAITEPVPLYLLDACGLTNKTPAAFSKAIEAETDVPPTVLKQTLDLFNGKQVKALVYNSQTTGPQTEQVLNAAKSNRIAVVPVTETLPAGKDYSTWMTDNIAALRSALG